MIQQLIVVGGDAAGMSAASQAKRMRNDGLEVLAFERSHYTSCARAESRTELAARSTVPGSWLGLPLLC